MSEHTFDLRERLDELRCRPTEWLCDRRAELVREQRRLHVEELAVTKVLDDRGQRDLTGNGMSARTARKTVEMARALESTPRIAAAAHAGHLSREQLEPVLEVADAASDAEWARRAPNCDPVDLNRIARRQRIVSTEDAAARRDAREWRMWWRKDAGMLSVRGELPDVDGALVESVFDRMIERMRPAKGQRWDTYAHRGADALVELCRTYADVEPTGRHKPHLVVSVPADGPAEVNGIPIAASTLEALRADATLETILVDGDTPLAPGRTQPALSPKITRAVRLRDGHCRWPGCERTTGLDTHHLVPRSYGGSDDLANLASVCKGGGTDHHHQLVPQGPYWLIGNPNQPDGLRLRHRDDFARAP